MDQKGFTAFGYGDMSFEQKMTKYKKNGVIYLIGDTALIYKQEYLKPLRKQKVGRYQNIEIYKID
jgi:hypothetical protein